MGPLGTLLIESSRLATTKAKLEFEKVTNELAEKLRAVGALQGPYVEARLALRRMIVRAVLYPENTIARASIDALALACAKADDVEAKK